MCTSSGLILLREIDYEQHRQVEVKIKPANNGNSSSQNSNVNIILLDITDVNDNWPTIGISPSVARITTNFPAISLVASARVTDRDSLSKKFTYSILTGDPTNIFTIDSDGNIFTTRCLSNAAVSYYPLRIQVSDGMFKTNKSLGVQVYKVSDTNFKNECGVDCNPVTFSVTSTAGGNITFTNVEKNGVILNNNEIGGIVAFPNSTDYQDLVMGITGALVAYFEKKFTLLRLNVTELRAVDTFRQRRSTQTSGFLNAQYTFEIKTTDATASELNPIKKNETIVIKETANFKLQTNPELSVLSGELIIHIKVMP